ncbi:unknown [Methanobrevibacter smithii CAG:186]|uniref:Uncharacterized protein n=1 Tax=Methanobrevibacter smithii CAG:186 TaxID=1263088 RepID=R7PUG4_METSM|nr:unknown [Methanobrevibacter smithii CAG:186]
MFTSPLAKIAPPSLAAALSLNVALVIFDLELKENRVIAPPFPNMTLLASKIEFSTIRSPLEI